MEMSRRGFLKTLAAASVAAVLPTQALAALGKVGSVPAADVAWRVEKSDYDFQIAVCYQFRGADGTLFRHAVCMPSSGHDEEDIAFLKKELTRNMKTKGLLH